MKIKFNLFGYEWFAQLGIVSNDPLERILSSVMKNTNEQQRKSKIQMIKCVRTISNVNPEWFERLGWKLTENVDMHTGHVSKHMGLGDGKDFVEANFEFEKSKPLSWYHGE